MKKCSMCGELKEYSEFVSTGFETYRKQCKACIAKIKQEYYQKNKEKFLERAKRSQQENREHRKEYMKKYNEENKEDLAKCHNAYYQQHKDTLGPKNKEYYQSHKEEINKKQYEYKKKKLLTNELYAMTERMRNLIRMSISSRGYTKKSKTQRLIGCSFEFLIGIIGPKPKGNYHLDHVCPCNQAQTEEELELLQHYSNLRWLPAKENMSKSDCKTPEAEEACIRLLSRPWLD